jgi:hypothetical protein
MVRCDQIPVPAPVLCETVSYSGANPSGHRETTDGSSFSSVSSEQVL